MDKIDLYVANLDCDHDAAAIERGMTNTPGLIDLRVYPKSAKVSLTFDPAVIQNDNLKAKLAAIGFPPQEGMALPE